MLQFHDFMDIHFYTLIIIKQSGDDHHPRLSASQTSTLALYSNHTGLWLALFAGFLGSSDTQTLRIPLYKGEPKHEAFDMNGASYYLDYDMELNSFAVEYYPNGRPSRFSANVRLGNENVLLEVNHPYSYRLGEDVYLTGYDVTKGNESNYCILQVVKQPWKYVMVAGILMMLAGAVLLFINGAKAYDKLG